MNEHEKDVVDDKGVDVYPVTSLRDPEAGDEYDAEKDVKVDVHTQLYDGVQRKMEQRHMQMIALAGTIGTGLFLNSGRIIAHGGPVGALLAFITTGSESPRFLPFNPADTKQSHTAPSCVSARWRCTLPSRAATSTSRSGG